MSSNNYSSYNYPYHQQSSAQQPSSYQSAPAPAQSSRQYQQAPSAATNQSADYLAYPGPSYSTSSARYGAAQENTWGGSSNGYAATRDNGNRAAEALRNMSNTDYANRNAAPNHSGFTANNTVSTHYSPTRSPQVQAQPPHTSYTAYDQTQARPRSTNPSYTQASSSRGMSSPATAAGYPTQRAQPQYDQQQTHQRTASPDQTQYSHSNATAVSRNASMAAAGTSQQYIDHSHRQLPDMDGSRSAHAIPSTTSYTPRPPASIVRPPSASIPEPYTGSSTTVDPTAVYDPWPEYQRKQAIRDAERAERERKEEEARTETEAEEGARQAQIAASPLNSRAKKAQDQATPAFVAASDETQEVPAGGSELEAEIRAMMAKMRELNGKDPQLLARIWEEERKAKVPKPSTATTRPVQQPAMIPPAQVPTPPIANQRKKATPREPSTTPVTKPNTPFQSQAVSASASTTTSVRTGGNTIWPPDKKLELANAAALYLTAKNPDRPLQAEQIIQMLNSNPSYVELCEQLEQQGLKLDRSIFAKSLLSAVPDVNSVSRKTTLQSIPPAAVLKAPAPPAVMKHPAPPAIMKYHVATPVAPSPRYTPAATLPANMSPYPPFPENDVMAAPTQIPVAEMISIKPELKPPANKEEAARKRNLSELIDLTQLDEEEGMGPPRKKVNTDPFYTDRRSLPHNDPAANVAAPINNFPTASIPAPTMDQLTLRPTPTPANELRYRAVVEPLDKRKALRRNTYNPATIARDVLLACGRHPYERQLNQHLDALKNNIPQISNESDLSTIKWNLIDPGTPPSDYFKDGIQALTEDGSEDEDRDGDVPQEPSSHATGGESSRVHALPVATNPFIKQKRRGRPPRHSLPNNTTTPSTPDRQTISASMSASAPRPSAATAVAGVGYSAFRSATELGPDGKPLPKKKGRPVGWRKAIHGSATAYQRSAINGHAGKYKSQQPSTLRSVGTGEEPIRIDSRSPSVANRIPQYQSFKCEWQSCKAELHNLETLKKHVFRVHNKETVHNTLQCLWADCSKVVASLEPVSNTRIESHAPHEFEAENAWQEHIQRSHFNPLAWEQGDGPADGLSDAHESEAYLSDARGRRVTPRITSSPAGHNSDALQVQFSASTPHGRGRPPKNVQEQDARETQNRLVSLKRRIGGPGMDRGGATLVNDKRRRGLIDGDGLEEELVDAED